MTLNKFRGFLYTTAKVLGDIHAIRKGRIVQRIGRRVAGKFTGHALGKFFK